VDLAPGEFVIVPVVLLNLAARRTTVLEVWRDRAWPDLEVALVHRSAGFFAAARSRLVPLGKPPAEPDRLMDCGGLASRRRDPVGGILVSPHPDRIVRRFGGGVERRVGKGTARVSVALPAGAPTVVGFKVTAPKDAPPGAVLTTHLVQRLAGGNRFAGGVAVQVRVRSRRDAGGRYADS
jgi:hypothetical protein